MKNSAGKIFLDEYENMKSQIVTSSAYDHSLRSQTVTLKMGGRRQE